MRQPNDVGLEGEDIACAFLQQNGYRIAERNWRYRRYEIDIIAWVDELMVVVEVKTRGVGLYKPEHYVLRRQWNYIAFAAGRYMDKIGYDWEVRFDIISVTITERDPIVRHYQDVFFPGR